MISGVTINDKRKQSYDFTAPYFEAHQLIAVQKNSTAKGLKDLAGKKIGVRHRQHRRRHGLARVRQDQPRHPPLREHARS